MPRQGRAFLPQALRARSRSRANRTRTTALRRKNHRRAAWKRSEPVADGQLGGADPGGATRPGLRSPLGMPGSPKSASCQGVDVIAIQPVWMRSRRMQPLSGARRTLAEAGDALGLLYGVARKTHAGAVERLGARLQTAGVNGPPSSVPPGT